MDRLGIEVRVQRSGIDTIQVLKFYSYAMTLQESTFSLLFPSILVQSILSRALKTM